MVGICEWHFERMSFYWPAAAMAAMGMKYKAVNSAVSSAEKK
jgi:hypothetical protein